MAFMRLEVFRDSAYIVDTSNGAYVVPCEVSGNCGDPESPHKETRDALRERLQPYCPEPITEDDNIELMRNVYVGRYSAPGYLDSTDWEWSTNRRKLEQELRAMYGPDEQPRDSAGRFASFD